MPREQRRGKCTRPESIRQTEQQHENQNGVCRVKNRIHHVMRAGLEAEQFAIRHVRNPGQRMPVACVAGCKSPAQSAPSQSILDDDIFGDVIIVIEDAEVITGHREINDQSDEQKQQRNEARPGHLHYTNGFTASNKDFWRCFDAADS